jgi:acyl dehydratase
MNYFEELKIGERVVLGSYTFTAENIKAFASRYDPQSFHLDEEAASHSHFGALCASGWQTAAASMRLIALTNQRELTARRERGESVPKIGPSPGVRDMRWVKPVYVGDCVTYASEIRELRAGRRPEFGLVVSQITGTNQNGELVYSAQGSVFVERRVPAPSN